MKKRILVYGDSNAWGFIPGIGTRFDEDKRWPQVASTLLGEEFEIIEDCISGRTTVYDDPTDPLRNGLKGLGYALNAHAPLDFVIIHLGINDLKFTDAKGATDGLRTLVNQILDADTIFPMPGAWPHFQHEPKVMVISAAHVHEKISVLFPESALSKAHYESKKLASYFQNLAQEFGIYFLDASLYAKPCIIDCLHMDTASHIALGEAVYKKISSIFCAERVLN